MAERPTDLRSDFAALRRRWLVAAAATAVGLGLGILYGIAVPIQLSSTALVLLASDSDQNGPQIATQVQIVLSTPVLGKAGSSVKPALSASEVKGRIKVSGPTPQLIEIKAFAPRAGDAQALGQAVADAFVATLTDNVRTVTGAAVGDLKVREAALTDQVTALQRQLNATNERLQGESPKSTDGIRDAQLKAQLSADQADIALQLDRVQSALAASGVSGASAPASIVQPAAPATGPSRLPLLVGRGVIGALLAGLVTGGLVVLRARRDPRLRARDDIADAVGSSVLADVRSKPQRSVAEWTALFETYVAQPVDAWAFRQLLRALAPQDSGAAGYAGVRGARLQRPKSITVVSLASDKRGMAIAPQLAAFVASLGISTRFVLATNAETAASLWAACSRSRPSQPRPCLLLESLTEPMTSVHTTSSQAITYDLTIVLAVVDLKTPWGGVPTTSATVLAMAPGVGTREQLARLAVALDETGRRIDGVVVADPDPADKTTGRRTFDERARRAPLPVRVTRTGQTPISEGQVDDHA